MSALPPHSAVPISPTEQRRPRIARFSGAIVVAVVFLAFIRLCGSDFTWWDDQGTIHGNGLLNPPTLATLRYYWTTPDQGLFIPVTYTVWTVLAKIAYVGRPDEFGILLNPWPFHTASVLVHIASALLVLNLLRRLIGQEVPALLGALFFALHPVQVEPVGWVSGFKDVLCWCLSLASLLVYVRRVQEVGDRPLWRGWEMPTCSLLLALAILSKPTAMVIPAAMWLIDGLLLRREWKRSAIALIPLFVLAAAGAVLARQAQYVEHVRAAALWERPFIVGDTLAFYVRKILCPATLTIDYGRMPRVAMSSPLVYVWWLVPAGLVALALWQRHRRPIWLAATGLFLIGVAPVTGITTFQMQNYSTVTDHYLYFALLGPALALAWALAHWPSRALRGATAIVLLALGVRTFLQTATWYDSFTLFQHAIQANPRTFLARANLAGAYLRRLPPQPDKAEHLVDEAYAIAPDVFFVLDAYASTKAGVGKRAEALKAWEEADRALAEGPRTKSIRGDFAADVANNLLGMHEYDEALKWATKAIAFEPNNPHAVAALVAARAATKAASTTRAATTPATSPDHPPASMPSRAAGPG